MNKIRSLNMRRLMFIAAAMLVVLIAVLFWAREIIREVIVLPVSYLIWAVGLIIRSTPQIFFWIALLIISFMVAYRGVRQKRKALMPVLPRPLMDEVDEQVVSGRLKYWAGKVNLLQMHKGAYFQSSFSTTVGHLLVDLLAYRYHLPAQEIENRLRQGMLDVPEKVSEYALHHLRRPESEYRSVFDLVWQSIVSWVQSVLQKLQSNPQSESIDQHLAYILQYMEEELEVLNDDTGR